MKIFLNNDWHPAWTHNQSAIQWAAASLLPPQCERVVVPSGGAALMAVAVRPIEIVNDRDGAIYTFFTILRDSRQRQQLLGLIDGGANSLELTRGIRPMDPVTRACEFYFACRDLWVPDVTARAIQRRQDRRAFFDVSKVFNPILERYYSAQIEDLPVHEAISRYDTARTYQLVDISTVKAGEIAEVLSALKNLKGRAIVVGTNAFNETQFADWRMVVEPFGAAPHTALVNFPERRKVAA